MPSTVPSLVLKAVILTLLILNFYLQNGEDSKIFIPYEIGSENSEKKKCKYPINI